MSAALPARLPGLRRPDDPLLRRCLLLAMLLHVWLVLVFGNAAGTAAPGQGVWGSLTVKLMGRGGGDPDGAPGEARPAPDNGPVGEAAKPRAGGTLRATESTAEQPGAEAVGRWSPVESTQGEADIRPSLNAAESPLTPVAPAQALHAAPQTELQAPARELPAAVQRLDARPAEALQRLAPADLQAPTRPDRPAPVPSAELPAPVRRLDAPAASPAPSALPRVADLRTPAPELPAAPTARELPAAPTARELPPPVRRLEAPAERDTATLPAPASLRTPAERPAASPAALPSAELPAAVKRLEANEPGRGARAALPRSSELRASPAPSSATAPAADAGELPPPVRRLEAAGGGANAVTPLAASALPRGIAGAAPGGSAVSELSNALPGQVEGPQAPAGFAPPSPGSPQAGSQLGHDVATPPSAAPAGRTPLNLNLPRGDSAARRGPGLLDLLPQPPERKSEMQKRIEEAGRDDCRNAHADKGLLAIVPLVLAPARDKGCKY